MNADTLSARKQYRRIVFCADDFGMSPAVNAGILALAAQGRLSATSVLVDAPAAAQDTQELLGSGLQLGLHLNFTESFGQQGVCLPLRHLIANAFLGRLDQTRLLEGVQRQLQAFHKITGRWPDYIDGHQHVHQLPGVREALLRGLQTLQAGKPWIRDTGRPRSSGMPVAQRFKAAVIANLGAAGLRRQALAAGHEMNSGFLGVYDFQGGRPVYERWLQLWLSAGHDGDVLMCHPACGNTPGDPHCTQRQAEFAVLSGPVLEQLLGRYNLQIMGQTRS